MTVKTKICEICGKKLNPKWSTKYKNKLLCFDCYAVEATKEANKKEVSK